MAHQRMMMVVNQFGERHLVPETAEEQFNKRRCYQEDEIEIIVVLVLFLVILPLFSFSSQLAEAKRIGSQEYGKVASR